MMLLYDLIYLLFFVCYLPVALVRGRVHRDFLLRLGVFPQKILEKLKAEKIIWLHTVSVGETQAASSLIGNLQRDYPNFRLVVSTVTQTGNQIARRLIRPEDLAIYVPLDISLVVKRIIRLINPKLFIIAETEIWPNLIMHLARKGTVIVLVNGRLSNSSFKGYRVIRPFLKGILQRFTLFCMQTEQDAEKIIRLGADPDKVRVTGNMKFDIEEPAASASGERATTVSFAKTSEDKSQDTSQGRLKQELGLSLDEQLFIAGSTHPGEEEIILQVFQELVRRYTKLRLLIAPRHIERTQKLEQLISKFAMQPQKVSQLNSKRRAASCEMRPVLILDSIGQLKSLYACADIVFIGGSLIAHGGQNLIEPAIFSKAILFGPYMFNFSKIAQLFQQKEAGIMVKSKQELTDISARLLARPSMRKALGQKARELVEENKGATLRNLKLLNELINRRVV